VRDTPPRRFSYLGSGVVEATKHFTKVSTNAGALVCTERRPGVRHRRSVDAAHDNPDSTRVDPEVGERSSAETLRHGNSGGAKHWTDSLLVLKRAEKSIVSDADDHVIANPRVVRPAMPWNEFCGGEA
jgi:hypothetical protein